MDFRIGQGYDLHRLVTGETLTIGGVSISHYKGLKGHSDADVLLHAICDACLGALGLGDIGYHFPPTDNQFENIASTKLLEKVYQSMADAGYGLQNLDSTLCLQAPKIQGHIPQMRQIIAYYLNTSVNRVSVKATTTEKVGPEGREEAISAHAMVLLTAI